MNNVWQSIDKFIQIKAQIRVQCSIELELVNYALASVGHTNSYVAQDKL